MKQFTLVFRKEMLEMTRSYKWLWVPLVFLLLGIMQPIVTYFLPDILKHAGNLPEGSVVSLPPSKGADVLAQTLSQYSTIGVLILVLSMMTVISGERQSGVAAMIYAKPIRFASYVAAKWAGILSLTTVSFLLGYAGAWYYTVQLIGPVDGGSAVSAGGFYLLWLWLICTMTMMVSSLLNHAGGIAFVSLGLTALLSLATSMLPRYMAWSPGRLSSLSVAKLQSEVEVSNTVAVVILSILCIVACQMITVYVLKMKPRA